MARIPVEKQRGGSKWWLWLLGLLILGGLIWLFADTFDGDATEDALTEQTTEEPADQQPTQVPPAGQTGQIVSFAAIVDAERPESLDGREVQLDNVVVTRVVGDSTFYVTPPGEETADALLVVLANLGEWQEGTGGGADGEYNVNPDEQMTLAGTLHRLEGDEAQRWGIADRDADELAAEDIYLRAERIE